MFNLSVCLSVCPSVRHTLVWYCIRTKYMNKDYCNDREHENSVFCLFFGNSQDFILNTKVETGGNAKLPRWSFCFSWDSCYSTTQSLAGAELLITICVFFLHQCMIIMASFYNNRQVVCVSVIPSSAFPAARTRALTPCWPLRALTLWPLCPPPHISPLWLVSY